jgi:hypothetical protein
MAKYLCHSTYGTLIRRKVLRHGDDGFIFTPKEVVLRIFIALKIHRSRPGLNPRSLDSVVSTITITPPRAMRSRRRWKDNIKMNVRQMGVRILSTFIWIEVGSSNELLVGTVVNLRVP